MNKELSPKDLIRYERNIKIPFIGAEGQKKLKNASVLIVGVGGLGSASAYYLAAAGIGRLGLVDNDVIELSNLNRQILHSHQRLGMLKVESAKNTLRELNPDLEVDTYPFLFEQTSAAEILQKYDVVVDGTDNFETRYLVNRLCVQYDKPFVYGAVFQFSGQISVFHNSRGPCFQCVFHQMPPQQVIEANRKPGVIGALPGIIGTIQTVEAIKLLLGVGESLIGRLLVVDGMEMDFSEIKVAKDSKCPICKR
jgi:molybdopterin/thiamine biosynthesis adenylyltransferase